MQDSQGLGIQVTHTNDALLPLLGNIQSLFNQLGEEFTQERNRIQELENRLASSRFHLAVLGQFKRGKSTLLNALLGEELLPAAVIPVTSVPTFLSWGPKRIAKVIFLNGHIEECSPESPEPLSKFLTRYVTEGANPRNGLGVAEVNIAHPSPLLEKGVVLIDTPGIGSTFQHNTEATLNFLPQCDGALFLISTDPPITQVEIEFLKAVRARVARIFFIMNKADYLSEGERQTAIEFFQRVLREQLRLDCDGSLFCVSARQGLEAKLKGNDSLWVDSGMSGLGDYLLKFLAEEKMHTLNQAIARKAGDILDDSLLRLRLKKRTLTLPLEDLEQRLAVFNQKLEEAKHQRLLTQDILVGDQRRLVEMLQQECSWIVKEAEAKLSQILDETLATTSDIGSVEKIMHTRLAEVVPELSGAGLARVHQIVDQRTQEILGAHREKAKALADTIRQTAAELFEIPYEPGKSSEGLEIRRKPYWVTQNWSVGMSPIPRGLIERLLPRHVAQGRVKKWLWQDIEAVVLRNVENIQWTTLQNIDDTFRQFSLDLDQKLTEIASATRGAIQEAHTQRLQRADSIGEELNRLSFFEAKLQEVQKELGQS